MKHLKLFALLCLLICTKNSLSQTAFGKCLDQHLNTGVSSSLDSITESLISKLETKDFYLIGEAHTFLANNDFQFSLIKALHRRKIFNIVNELPHATCFLFNQYLETGDEQLLTKLKPQATYELLKKIRSFNLTKPKDQQIRYYGIDYLDAKYDYDNFYLSLKIINDRQKLKKSPLKTHIEKYLLKGNFKSTDIQILHDTIKLFLSRDSIFYKEYYGDYYYDLKLMASNIIGYKVDRDNYIFESFLILYDNWKQTKNDTIRFLSFYGMGHLYNFGDKLINRKESPVYENVVRIGISYYHCIGGWEWTEPSYKNIGIYTLRKESLKQIELRCKENKWQVGYILSPECLKYKNGRKLDAIMIFNDYGDRRMNSWKFD